jgi:hypothetical protein
MRNFSVFARSRRSARACSSNSCSFKVSSGRRSSGSAASPSAVFSSSTSETAAPICSHMVWQTVQLNRNRFLASAIMVMVTMASFPRPAAPRSFKRNKSPRKYTSRSMSIS